MGCEYALGCIHRFIESEIGVQLFSVFMVGGVNTYCDGILSYTILHTGHRAVALCTTPRYIYPSHPYTSLPHTHPAHTQHSPNTHTHTHRYKVAAQCCSCRTAHASSNSTGTPASPSARRRRTPETATQTASNRLRTHSHWHSPLATSSAAPVPHCQRGAQNVPPPTTPCGMAYGRPSADSGRCRPHSLRDAPIAAPLPRAAPRCCGYCVCAALLSGCPRDSHRAWISRGEGETLLLPRQLRSALPCYTNRVRSVIVVVRATRGRTVIVRAGAAWKECNCAYEHFCGIRLLAVQLQST